MITVMQAVFVELPAFERRRGTTWMTVASVAFRKP